MNRFSRLVFFFYLSFLMACSSGEQVRNASKLQPGEQFGELTIKEVRNSEEGFLVVFKDTLVLEGVVVNSAMGDYGIKKQVLSEKIKINENIIDLGLADVLYFRNYNEMPQYFDDSMYEETPNGKVLKEGHSLKVKVAGIQINTNARDLVSGEVVEVLLLNGEPVTAKSFEEKKELTQEQKKNDLEGDLWKLIEQVSMEEAPEGGLFYSNDIKDFQLYTDNDDFRSFVDDVFAQGYGIEQAEGHYYLYIEEPANYEDGEVVSDEMLKFEDLKVGQEVDGVTIVKHELVPRDYFILEFSGEFTTSGELYFDEMWYELTFVANEGEPLKRTLEVTGLPIKMMSYVKFNNKQEVRAALGEEKVKEIESGGSLPVTVVVRDFKVSGAFESEYGNMFEFVSLVE
jgi:hypothetical protein